MMPMTSDSAKRSFSKLKLINIYLRNRLGQEKLFEPALISIEEEVSSTMDYNHRYFCFKKIKKSNILISFNHLCISIFLYFNFK
jgi:hypothetical protein